MKYLSLIYFVLIFSLLNVISFAQTSASESILTKEYKEPVCAHFENELEKVKVTAIRGKLYFSDNQPPTSSIVSLYYIGKKESKFINSILVGSDGYFDFKKLKNGNYYLKTGTIDGGFNCVNIKILLAPDDKDSLVEDLEIPMEVGT